MNKKKILVLLFAFLITSCGKKNINSNIFESYVKLSLDYVLNDDTPLSIRESYQEYYVEKGNIYTHVYDYDSDEYYTKNKYFSTNELRNGKLIKNENNQIYMSIEGKHYCAVKDFDEENISIYDISEKEKCHKLIKMNGNLNIELLALNDNGKSLYTSNEFVSDDILLVVMSNILDHYNITYKWYRNNVEIPNVSGTSYKVEADYEDAEYYIEATTPDGQVIISNPIIVKIEK